jgi:tripartite motif-containing protein 71
MYCPHYRKENPEEYSICVNGGKPLGEKKVIIACRKDSYKKGFYMKRLNPENFRSTLLSLLSIMAVVFLFPGCENEVAEQHSYKLVRKFGVEYSWWESSNPLSVSVNSRGDIFIADAGNNRVRKFTSDGVFMNTWGGQGSHDGAFDRPHGIAIDKGDNIYITDTYNHRIQQFDSSGILLNKWGDEGKGAGQFDLPTGIAIDIHNNVYVGDAGNHRIQKFDGDGKFVLSWGKQGSGPGEFEGDLWLAVDTQGYIFVSDDENERIQKFDSCGSLVAAWGGHTFWGDRGKFAEPEGVAVDTCGNIYVADLGQHRIQKFTNAGEFLLEWDVPGNFWWYRWGSPYGVALSQEGKVYVTDPGHERILIFAPSSVPSWDVPSRTFPEFLKKELDGMKYDYDKIKKDLARLFN